jgi:glycosyltransferase 2 family protein
MTAPMAAGRRDLQPARLAVKNWKRNLAGVLISAACLAFIAWRIDFHEAMQAIAAFHWQWLILGCASLAAGYAARIVRWATLLRAAGATIRRRSCVAPFLGSIALNNVLPMRLGDVVRALVFPAAIGVGRVVATASLVMERLVDLMTLLACLVAGLAATSRRHLPDWLLGSAEVLAIVGSILLALIFFFSGPLGRWAGARGSSGAAPRRERLFRVLAELLGGFEGMSRLPVLLALFLSSLLVWAGEAGLFWALLHGFGLDASPGAAVVVMAIATLSTLVPSSPGYVGPFHLAAYSAIAMLGGTPAQAASFAVLSHLGVWLPTTLAGAVAIFLNPQLFGRAQAVARQES